MNYLRLWLHIVLLCVIYIHGNSVLPKLAMPHLLYLSLNITCSQSPFLIPKRGYRCVTTVPYLLLHRVHAPVCAAADFRLVSPATLRNSEMEICHSHSSTLAPITYLFSHHFFVTKLKSQLSETSNKSRKTVVSYLCIHPTELYSNHCP